jgi:hypothetical protein
MQVSDSRRSAALDKPVRLYFDEGGGLNVSFADSALDDSVIATVRRESAAHTHLAAALTRAGVVIPGARP